MTGDGRPVGPPAPLPERLEPSDKERERFLDGASFRPFEARWLIEPDGYGLALIEVVGEAWTLGLPSGGVLRATVRGGQCVDWTLLDGREALKVHERIVWQVSPELEAAACEAVGLPVDGFLEAVFGRQVRMLVPLKAPAGRQRWRVVRGSPRREAVLEVEIAPDGEVLRADWMIGAQGMRAAWGAAAR